jgi:hypothetical protein
MDFAWMSNLSNRLDAYSFTAEDAPNGEPGVAEELETEAEIETEAELD